MPGENRKEIIEDLDEKSNMKAEAIAQARYAVEKLKIESKISKYIKQFFDKKYGPNWHCIVGKNFHSYVSYESKNFIFFYDGPIAILLYKMGG